MFAKLVSLLFSIRKVYWAIFFASVFYFVFPVFAIPDRDNNLDPLIRGLFVMGLYVSSGFCVFDVLTILMKCFGSKVCSYFNRRKISTCARSLEGDELLFVGEFLAKDSDRVRVSDVGYRLSARSLEDKGVIERVSGSLAGDGVCYVIRPGYASELIKRKGWILSNRVEN